MQFEILARKYGNYVKQAYDAQHGIWPKLLDDNWCQVQSADGLVPGMYSSLCALFRIPITDRPEPADVYDFSVALRVLYHRYSIIRSHEFKVGKTVRFSTAPREVVHSITAVTPDFLLLVTGRDRPQHPLWFV